jgi:hypothetical protein
MKIPATIRMRLRRAAVQYGVFVAVGLLTTLASMWRFSRPANEGLLSGTAVECLYLAALVPAFVCLSRLVLDLVLWLRRDPMPKRAAEALAFRSLSRLSTLMLGDAHGK